MPDVILEGHGRPNVFLVGKVGQKYKDLDSGLEWVCRGERGFIRVDGDDQSDMYNWDMIESGGGGNELLLGVIDRSISGTLEIPEGITDIGARCFYNCTKLKKVIIPEGVRSISDYAFSGCNGLSELSLPNSLQVIGNNAFDGCYSLEKIDLSKTSLTYIMSSAFYGCSSLKEVTFPDTITTLEAGIFGECSNLTTINVPWAEGAIGGAPWGANSATINYNYVPPTE